MVKKKTDVEDNQLKSKNSSEKKITILIISLILFIAAIIGTVLLLVIGAGPKWKKQIGFSNLKVDDDYIVGEIQNKTDKHLKLVVHFELKSGSITDTDECFINIDPFAIDDLECLAYKKDKSYKVKVTDVEIKEITNKTFKDDEKISEDDLEDYFNDIYEEHNMFFHTTFGLYEKEFEEFPKYPSLTNVTYSKSSDGDSIHIYNSLIMNDKLIGVGETYKVSDGSLFLVYIMMPNDDSLVEFMQKALSMGYYFDQYDTGAISRIRKVISDGTEKGHCIVASDHCFGVEKDQDSIRISITDDWE